MVLAIWYLTFTLISDVSKWYISQAIGVWGYGYGLGLGVEVKRLGLG